MLLIIVMISRSVMAQTFPVSGCEPGTQSFRAPMMHAIVYVSHSRVFSDPTTGAAMTLNVIDATSTVKHMVLLWFSYVFTL